MDPEDHFRSGVTALAEGRAAHAIEHFEAAVAMERARGVPRPQMRYLSYLGLSLATADRPTRQAVEACEKAAARDPFDSVLLLNLGRVYLMIGKTSKALAAFERGLQIDPGDRRLKSALARLDRRRKPPVPGLDRDHPINRSLGRLRASLFRKA